MPVSRKRVAIYGVVGSVCICSALAIREFKFARPTGSGPAGPPVDAAAYESVWTAQPITLVGIGDSVTAGLGADTPDKSYFQRLLINPPDEYPALRGVSLSGVLPNIDSCNYAISGTTSATHLQVIQEELPVASDETFGVVVMTTGGNDLIHSYGRQKPRECAMYGATLVQAEPWIANFERRLNQMLDGIDSKFPGGCEIYLANIYDPTDASGDAASIFLPPWPDGLEIHARYNDVIQRVAVKRKNVVLVDLYGTFLGHGSRCRWIFGKHYDKADPHYWYYTNVEDPNTRGYDAIRRVFLNTIASRSMLRSLDHQDN